MERERLIGLARQGFQRTNGFLARAYLGNSFGKGSIIASSAMLGLSVSDRLTEIVIINASTYVVSIVDTIKVNRDLRRHSALNKKES